MYLTPINSIKTSAFSLLASSLLLRNFSYKELIKFCSIIAVQAFCTVLLFVMIQNTKAAEVDYSAIVSEIVTMGDQTIAQYQPQNGLDSADIISDLYFDVFEAKGMEKDLAMHDQQLKTQLESYFSALTGYTSQGADEEVVKKAWLTLKTTLLETAANQETNSGFWSVLIQAFLILLREGFEAILVITALVSYLQRTAPQQVKVIWQGVLLALVASILTAWLLSSVYKISGASQEALEGVTMLVAAAVLFYVSYWMISKSESDRWQKFIRKQINSAVSSGSAWALGFAAFLAVYREGAETVLFYQALVAGADNQNTAIVVGFAAAALALVIIYYVMHKASVRLPIGVFFTFTAILLYYLAFTFIGNGVLELQEASWINTTPIADWSRISFLGFNPTIEGAIAQVLFLLPLPYAYYVLVIVPRYQSQQEK